MNSAAMKTEIEEQFEREKNKLIDVLHDVKYVCATADAWTCRDGMFFGSTLHWLEPTSLQRKSAPFIRHRLEDLLNFDEVSERLTSMCEEYRIAEKMVAIVTNNGWKGLGIYTTESNSVDEFHEINLDSPLPTHNECIALTHTLSQIVTADAANALADKSYKEIHTCVFEKLAHFWQKSNDAPRPTEGRCNSLFESLRFIMNKGRNAINAISTEFGVPTLTRSDHTFLLEFVQITKPIANAIEQLPQSNCYYATFLPTIYTIDHSFKNMWAAEFKYCRPLLQAMHTGLKQRFEYCFNLNGERCRAAVLATSTHPFFKTRWLPPEHVKDKTVVEMLTNAVKDELQLQCELLNSKNIEFSHVSFAVNKDLILFTESTKAAEESDNFEYYFASDDTSKATASESQIVEAVSEVHSFLDRPCERDRNNLEQLDAYKMIREVFVKYNTILTSSAPVERIFSFESK